MNYKSHLSLDSAVSDQYLKQHCYSFGNFCSNGLIGTVMVNKPTEVVDEAIYQQCLWKNSPSSFFMYI